MGVKLSGVFQNENGHFLADAVSSGQIWQGELDEQDFVRVYRPVKNHLDPYSSPTSSYDMFSDHGDQLEFVKGTNANHVWSCIDGESYTLILPGVVGGSDRTGYFITEVPWVNQSETVLLAVRIECKCFNQDLFDDGDEAGDPDCETCEGAGTYWVEVKKLERETASVQDISTGHKTLFLQKAEILADLWMNHRENKTFKDYIAYNDLGLPLAYCYANSIVTELNGLANVYVEEAFDLLLSALQLEDSGFLNLDELLLATGTSSKD